MTPSLPPLILASVSPRRRDLLREIHVAFQVIPSDVTELHQEHLTARELSLVNAYRKARAVSKRFPDHLVLAADTLVYLGTRLFGKPSTRLEAFAMLTDLSGQTHQVITGVSLMHLRAHRQILFSETTFVTFQRLTEAQIRNYLAAVDTLDKAGAYAVQERGGEIISSIDGSYSNVVGLPVERLRAELEAWGA